MCISAVFPELIIPILCDLEIPSLGTCPYSFVRAAITNTTDWVDEATEVYFLPGLRVGSPRSRLADLSLLSPARPFSLARRRPAFSGYTLSKW